MCVQKRKQPKPKFGRQEILRMLKRRWSIKCKIDVCHNFYDNDVTSTVMVNSFGKSSPSFPPSSFSLLLGRPPYCNTSRSTCICGRSAFPLPKKKVFFDRLGTKSSLPPQANQTKTATHPSLRFLSFFLLWPRKRIAFLPSLCHIPHTTTT